MRTWKLIDATTFDAAKPIYIWFDYLQRPQRPDKTSMRMFLRRTLRRLFRREKRLRFPYGIPRVPTPVEEVRTERQS